MKGLHDQHIARALMFDVLHLVIVCANLAISLQPCLIYHMSLTVCFSLLHMHLMVASWPAGQGIPVVEHLRNADGTLSLRPHRHTMYLVAANADLVGRKKVSHSNAVAAYVSCETCRFQSTSYALIQTCSWQQRTAI